MRPCSRGPVRFPQLEVAINETLGIFAEDSVQFGLRLSISAGRAIGQLEKLDAVVVTRTGERYPPGREDPPSAAFCFPSSIGRGRDLARCGGIREGLSFADPERASIVASASAERGHASNEDLRSERSKVRSGA